MDGRGELDLDRPQPHAGIRAPRAPAQARVTRPFCRAVAVRCTKAGSKSRLLQHHRLPEVSCATHCCGYSSGSPPHPIGQRSDTVGREVEQLGQHVWLETFSIQMPRGSTPPPDPPHAGSRSRMRKNASASMLRVRRPDPDIARDGPPQVRPACSTRVGLGDSPPVRAPGGYPRRDGRARLPHRRQSAAWHGKARRIGDGLLADQLRGARIRQSAVANKEVTAGRGEPGLTQNLGQSLRWLIVFYWADRDFNILDPDRLS